MNSKLDYKEFIQLNYSLCRQAVEEYDEPGQRAWKTPKVKEVIDRIKASANFSIYYVDQDIFLRLRANFKKHYK